jgi:CheY-like chemotaxis protein
VFANLLSNASKYTPPCGVIHVSATREDDEVVVRVTDNGNGITPEMLPRIFGLFVQERQDLERAQGGLGIGLAIVRSLVDAHGGSVTAASEGKGQGSTFSVRLPAATRPHTSSSLPVPVEKSANGGRRVLLVDDNRSAAELLADSLRAMGHHVRVAYDGPGALNIVSSFAPDVALLDLGLPVMDGFELAQRLRVEGGLAGLPLIALTGYAQEVDRQRTAAAGFDGHLAKPVDVHSLDAMIRETTGANDNG